MPKDSVSPARLFGDDLRRWYLRTPAEVESERQAKAAEQYHSFFGSLRSDDPDLGFNRGFFPAEPDTDPAFARDFGSGRDIDPGFSRGAVAAIGPRGIRTSAPTSQPFRETQSRRGSIGAGRTSSMASPPMQPLSSRRQNTPSVRQASADPPQRHGIWVAGRQPGELDPSQTEVFRPGSDGKLHPVAGWRTTGPFDFADWSKMFDWSGVGGDLADITSGALDFMGGGGLAGDVLTGLRYKIGQDVVRGIIHGHHSWPKFMGGPAKQELARLYQSLHVDFHEELAKALREAGFPRIGGKGGGAEDWAGYFRENVGKADEAMEILRQTTRDFDRRNGTHISKYLERTLGSAKTPPNP